jgi:hypothetical protein
LAEDSGLNDEEFDRDAEGSGSFLFSASSGSVGESEADSRPIRELYSVFSRPRTPADEEAAELARRWGALDIGWEPDPSDRPSSVPEPEWRASQPGKVLKSEGRLLLAGLGEQEDMLYAAPTENGHIARALLPNGGGGCGPPGEDGLVLAYTYRHGGGLVVYGLVADEIASVEVAVQDKLRPAQIGENAFGLRVADGKPSHLHGIVLRRRDGSHREIGLG